MAKIYDNFSELIGGTPLLKAQRYCAFKGVSAEILVKLEYLNPAGSAKDRVARSMLDDAERRGLITKNSVIIEPTSGNTGIGLAAVARSRGYRVILTMPDTMSVERRKLLAAYGAELILTEGSKGMQGAVDEALRLCGEIKGSFMPSQFENPANSKAHMDTTGPEIWEDAEGRIDIFVAGVGTGGTITGTGEYLKSRNPEIKIVAVEPFESPLLSKGKSAPHGIQGIGANFIPSVLKREIIDEIMPVRTADAYEAAREFSATEGPLAGISSGAALHAAFMLAKRPENGEKTIVALLPDSGERYLSTELYER